MEELNEGQKRICGHTSGHILVIAGPGTGKTYSMAKKVAHLLKEGVEPSSILCITFTNRAACELKERIRASINVCPEDIFTGTIHKLGLKLIKEYTKGEAKVIDREIGLQILKQILNDERKAKMEQRKIERIKNQMLFLEEDPVYEMYQNELKKKEAYDYEDLILTPLVIFESIPWKSRIKYIVVDEFQDLNRAQYRFISKIAKDHGSYICAVGDADQSIYGFRGSDVRIFLEFEKDYPDCEIIRLSENYRSTKTIMDASTHLIRHNRNRFENPIFTRKKDGPPIKIVKVKYPSMAGDFIVNEIERKIGGSSHLRVLSEKRSKENRTLGFSDFAVIYRTHEEGELLKKSFERSGIPYQIIGGRLAGRENSIKGLLEDIKKVLSEVKEKTERNLYPSQFFKIYPSLRESPDLIEIIEHLFPDTPMEELLDELKLLSPGDDYNPYSDSVTLTTMHRVKGLEFSCVFIVGLDEGNIPHTKSMDYDIEEERRLLYVGMTRAKDELFLIHSQNRIPSSFLKEIPAELTENVNLTGRGKTKKIGLFDS